MTVCTATRGSRACSPPLRLLVSVSVSVTVCESVYCNKGQLQSLLQSTATFAGKCVSVTVCTAGGSCNKGQLQSLMQSAATFAGKCVCVSVCDSVYWNKGQLQSLIQSAATFAGKCV